MVKQTLIGQKVGKYQVVEVLGRGGMAEVYKAYQESLDRYVAIKVMHSFLADEEGVRSGGERSEPERRAPSRPSLGVVRGVETDLPDPS